MAGQNSGLKYICQADTVDCFITQWSYGLSCEKQLIKWNREN